MVPRLRLCSMSMSHNKPTPHLPRCPGGQVLHDDPVLGLAARRDSPPDSAAVAAAVTAAIAAKPGRGSAAVARVSCQLHADPNIKYF